MHRERCWDTGEIWKIFAWFLSLSPENPSYVEGICWSWFSDSHPNHVLLCGLCRGGCRTEYQTTSIQRQGVILWIKMDFASATALRQHQKDQDFLERFMPSVAYLDRPVRWSGRLFSLAPLSNLIKSRPNHHLSGQSKKWLYTLKLLKQPSLWKRLVQLSDYRRYTKACQALMSAYILMQARKWLAGHSCPWIYWKVATSQVFEGGVSLVSRISKEP